MIAAAVIRVPRRGGAPARARVSRRGHPTPTKIRHRFAPALPRAGAGVRIFVLSVGVLSTAFLLALLYLRFSTAIATGGYGVQELERRRDELRRENQLLELQLRRLDTPTRIEAEAQRLGLQKARAYMHVPAVPAVAAGSR